MSTAAFLIWQWLVLECNSAYLMSHTYACHNRMDELNDLSPTYSQPGSPSMSQPRTPASNSTGITLVLPSLKALKSSKNGVKAGRQRPGSQFSGGFLDSEMIEKRLLRPVKLKPLKEVLIKLITQIKRCVISRRQPMHNLRILSPGRMTTRSSCDQSTWNKFQVTRMWSNVQWILVQ